MVNKAEELVGKMIWRKLVRKDTVGAYRVTVWSMQQKCCGQEGIVHAGSWSWHR